MYIVAFDTETAVMRRGKRAPELACVSFAGIEASDILKTAATGFVGWSALYDADNGCAVIADLLNRDDVLLVGFNTAFDVQVLMNHNPDLIVPFFNAYEKDRITCAMLREKLLNLAKGTLEQGEITGAYGKVKGYSLAGCMLRRFKVDRTASKQTDAWRYRYHTLLGTPLEAWPLEAKQYALTDAADHLRLYCGQWTLEQVAVTNTLVDEFRQARKALGLSLQESWSLRTDESTVVKTAQHAEREWSISKKAMQSVGLIRQDGTLNKAASEAFIKKAYDDKGEECPLTAGGKSENAEERKAKQKPSLSYDALIGSGHPLLLQYASAREYSDFLSKNLTVLLEGANGPIQYRYDSLLNTGRTSTSPNLQNPPREGPVRECFIARPGYVLCSNDYNQVELCTFGQSQLWLTGKSEIARAINDGLDCHTYFAALFEGKPYADVKRLVDANDKHFKEIRQLSKVPNFGYPGGMGPAKLIEFAWNSYGIVITLAEAKKLRRIWGNAWEPETYFRTIKGMLGAGGIGNVVQLKSGRIRGNVWFTQAANTYFQGLSADGAGNAIFKVAKECYAIRSSALYGSRMCLFLHDELLGELPDYQDQAHFAAMRLSEVMNSAMAEFVPDVKISSQPALMRRWYKKASAVYDSKGMLRPWEPK